MNECLVDETQVLSGGKPVDEQGARQAKFLKGPVPWPWLCAASSAGRSALAVGLAVHYLAGRRRSRTVALSHGVMEHLRISRQATYRALVALEEAGLVTVERGQGRAPRVTIQGRDDDDCNR